MHSFAEQLAQARRSAGLTQEQLADSVHVARNTISSWEHGRTQPDLETIRVLGKVLNTDFLSADTTPDENHDDQKEIPDEPVSTETAVQSSPPRHLSKKTLCLIAAAAVALISLIVCLLIVTTHRGPADIVQDSTGVRYAISDYKATAPNVPGQAYLSISTSLETHKGDSTDFYFFEFNATEENGVAFHIDRLDMIVFFADKADAFHFSDTDLEASGDINPDFQAHGIGLIANGGFPTNQDGLRGVGVMVSGTDENGTAKRFTSYLPFAN